MACHGRGAAVGVHACCCRRRQRIHRHPCAVKQSTCHASLDWACALYQACNVLEGLRYSCCRVWCGNRTTPLPHRLVDHACARLTVRTYPVSGWSHARALGMCACALRLVYGEPKALDLIVESSTCLSMPVHAACQAPLLTLPAACILHTTRAAVLVLIHVRLCNAAVQPRGARILGNLGGASPALHLVAS